jgi:SPP1 gp7 family putative phage head morphogenesis protein
VSGEAAAQLIERADRALKRTEDETIDRIYRTLDASYKQLERELLKAYEQQSGNLSLLPNQRKVVILEQVKNLLSLIDPKASKQLRKEFESLLSNASEQGRSLSESLVKAIANETLKSFVGVPIEALRFQAEDGVKRLARHGEEFASRASAVVEMGLIQGWGARKVASQLRAELGVAKGRAESIARTETASAQNSAIEANLKANGFELFQVFATIGERTCPTCAHRNQQVYKLGEPSPPYHPKCRCSISAIRQEWLEAGLIDLAWSQKYREAGLAELAEQGKQANTGISPFEKAAGLTTAPKPVWKPGDKIQPTQDEPPHQKLIDRGPRDCGRVKRKIKLRRSYSVPFKLD